MNKLNWQKKGKGRGSERGRDESFTVVLYAIAAVTMAAELEMTSLKWSSAKASNISLFNKILTYLQYINNINFNNVPTISITYSVIPTSSAGSWPFRPDTISTKENWITSIEAKDMIKAHTMTDKASNRDRPTVYVRKYERIIRRRC